ncbi:alpha/beta fold hydrolase [Robiginitomaculum antarcticum]|uniref:alpha/beta fold hydrolase n=1 Tax=Robiginitomaculum antarcticum TaxID=437507 RepID=UPI00037D5EE2|nr:alpha/beta hydrolase [Robiginitomaculum antarcticum]
MTKLYQDIYYTAPDSLTLYARDYDGKKGKPDLLCLHGLTRNSADFHQLAIHLGDRFRVVSVDQRGRGNSDYDTDPQNYRPDVYCADMFALIAHLKLENPVVIGTSMGGIMTMIMSAMRPGLFRAAILNDIGPEIDPAGIKRIKGYVGGSSIFETWDDAAQAMKAQGPDVFPLYTDEDWMAFARRTFKALPDGRPAYNYDPEIARPFKTDAASAAPPVMWPFFEALKPIPVLSIRGGLSDLLSPATVDKMQTGHPDFSKVEVPDVGHAPMLDEPAAITAIDSFLNTLAERTS